MSIKYKLLLIGCVAFLILVFLSFFLYFSVQSFNLDISKNKISHQIATYAFQRRLIMDEYLLHELPRSKEQWMMVNSHITGYIESNIHNFLSDKEKPLMDSLIHNIYDNSTIFLQLLVINENSRGQNVDAIHRDQKNRLVNQLLVKSQDIISLTGQLARINQEDILLVQRNIVFLLVGFILSLILTVTTTILFLLRSIAAPITKLQKGIKLIAAGDLHYKVDIHGHNEIGELASSFNEMTSKLRVSMGKIDEELQKFRLAFDNAADHIIITNPEGVILYANKGAENATGYSQREMIGKKPSLWGKLMSEEFYDDMWKTIRTYKKEFTGEITNRRKNGSEYQAQIKIAPVFDNSHNIKFFIGIERDITKEKEVDRAKTEFVLLASHQLRTPLSTINWYTEMLLSGDVGKLSKKQQKYISKVHYSSQRMVKLVNTLLDISHLELGMFVTSLQSVDIVKLALNVVDDQKRDIDQKGITFIRKFHKNIPRISTDPKLINIVFQNLLSNAIKYSLEKGKVVFSISMETAKQVEIKISDNGCGIPRYQQDKIFTKLFRADNARVKDTGGAGLGLYIVKSIVERLGGKISFESEENGGTTFFITLPIKPFSKKKKSYDRSTPPSTTI